MTATPASSRNGPAAFGVCVYCGSRSGARPAYADAARRIGQRIAARGWRLVYGGGRVGLMGLLADAALAVGGSVVGVIPESLMRREVGHAGLSELHVVPTMHLRKQMMAERADAFIALPGGIGTFEELFEVWSWVQLGYHDRPVALLDVADYYQGLLGFLDRAVAEGFLDAGRRASLIVEHDVDRLLDRVAAAPGLLPDDLSRI